MILIKLMNKSSKIEKKRISILGCGWLGLPLAKRLIDRDSTSEVKGSTTSLFRLDTLKEAGIKGYIFSLDPGFSPDSPDIEKFFDTDSLVISLPPKLSKSEPGHYVKQVEAIVEQIKRSPVNDIIFLSSTGIYPDRNRVMVESDVSSSRDSASPEMIHAENLLNKLSPRRTVSIARLAGLIGYDRIPGKYVRGKKELDTGALPVNYIHPTDAVEMIATMLSEGLYNETFNIVAPLHPTRREIYNSNCAQFGWETPTYTEAVPGPDFKIISGEKFSQYYNYDFQFPDPLHFEYELNH